MPTSKLCKSLQANRFEEKTNPLTPRSVFDILTHWNSSECVYKRNNSWGKSLGFICWGVLEYSWNGAVGNWVSLCWHISCDSDEQGFNFSVEMG